MPHREDDHIREGDHFVGTGTEARAGATGHNVRHVLAWGVIGCVVLFAGVYLYFFA
jgi:hypothetical protein